MITTIQKWGNSQGIRIPKTILSSVNWKEGEPLTLHAEDNKIVIEPAMKRKNIKELFEGYDGNYETQEVDWGEPMGKEVW